MENNTKGTAINFKRFMKIVPNGSIQLIVNALQPNELDNNAQTIPSIIPIRIFQCSGSFFMRIL